VKAGHDRLAQLVDRAIYRAETDRPEAVNWVDVVCISVVGFSALLAFVRGFLRELLGIGSWIAAGFFAVWSFPLVRTRFHDWIGNPDFADFAGFGAMFLLALIVLSVLAGMLGSLVQRSQLGGVDRTLGVVFGLLRGAVLIAFAYIAAGIILPPDRWPMVVLRARTLPYAFEGAEIAVSLLPPDYRPVVPIPPEGRQTKAEDLLRANPQGRATAHP
jgi:membrane protein required for colicin V production